MQIIQSFEIEIQKPVFIFTKLKNTKKEEKVGMEISEKQLRLFINKNIPEHSINVPGYIKTIQ
ncbi:hypothetical protein F0919_16660 [Taibaiella lutea]|uniref:Uncharacterized protein n=1 Tax=Taibaiella lutea TaxID=2608001 RepID=A0A5M6CD86_9BACT|nr:hypothetical protein [Taibaiella lutea]KAA5532420.1 hypothetical protein F0919_16660 [Taibaiella lutea]